MSAKRINKLPMVEMVLQHLIEVGNITGLEAGALYKCRHLPRRIKDLRDRGLDITSETKWDTTGQRYVRYHLETPRRRCGRGISWNSFFRGMS